jgi:hypothetical protein
LAGFALGANAQYGANVDGGVVPAVDTKASPNKVQQVGCSSCGGGLLGPGPDIGAPAWGGHRGGGFAGGGCGPGGCGAGGCGGDDDCGPPPCYAGKEPCDCPGGDCSQYGPIGGTLMGIYQCICCNDPCYEPRWIPLANNAFFVDGVRPVTQMKLGFDFGWDLPHPDKGELFWPRIGQKGPQRPQGNAAFAPRSLDYSRAYMVNEAAVGGVFSMFVETSILEFNPENGFAGASGFGDLVIGTKNMVLDCELLQVAFQTKTFIPTGNFTRGLGTGHVSIEPSLIAALKLTNYSYLQGQVGYRFPIGGTSGFQGSLVYGGLAYNHLLWNCGYDIQLIGTVEGNVACVSNGLYTDPLTGRVLSANSLGGFLNAGPGIRLVLCKKVDVGIGGSFHLTNESYIGHDLRAEFRWRF